MEKIHTEHQGITKCLERVRVSVWWPGITPEIKPIVDACEHYLVHKPRQQTESLMITHLPTGPWHRVAVDLCLSQGKDYMVVVDYYLRWIENLHLSYTTTAACIAKLKYIFARFVIPTEPPSDNGPQLSSLEFKSFVMDLHL